MSDNSGITDFENKSWSAKHLDLKDEFENLRDSYLKTKKCPEILTKAKNAIDLQDWNNAIQLSITLIENCEYCDFYNDVIKINKLRSDTYTSILTTAESLIKNGEFSQASNKLRESMFFSQNKDYSLGKIKEISLDKKGELLRLKNDPAVVDSIMSNDTYDIMEATANIVCQKYNTVNVNKTPKVSITFSKESTTKSKKIYVEINTTEKGADLAFRVNFYPPGAYRFNTEDIENYMVLDIIQIIHNNYVDYIDTTTFTLEIIGSADRAGFNGKKFEVEDKFLNAGLIVEPMQREAKLSLDNLVNSTSDYDKNLALAFLRAQVKEDFLKDRKIPTYIKTRKRAEVRGKGPRFRSVTLLMSFEIKTFK